MDSSDFPVSKSPRKELQGPRPAPLKLHKDSYKIKKPPVAPPPQNRHQQQQQKQQQRQQHHPAPTAAPPRPPVIIYTVSPKVIHTNPNDFMTLVQRLTGSSSSSSSSSTSYTASSFTPSFASASASSSSSYDPLRDHSTGAISPAARYASIERTKKQSPTERNKKLQIHNEDHSFIMGGGGGGGGINSGFVEGIEMDHNIERSCLFPGILSPGPTSLPMISPTFFSPPSDPNTFSFLHDLSPVVHGNKNFIEGSFMPSPSGFISPHLTSPTPSIDLFNSFFFDF